MTLRKYIILILCIGVITFLWWTLTVNILIDKGVTKAKSKIVQIQEEEKYFLPEDTMNSACVQFIVKGLEDRETFVKTMKEYSNQLGLEFNLVYSAVLGEQIRISCKGIRTTLKDTILYTTPTIFRSKDVSLGLWGIKLGTAYKIQRDAISYGYGDDIKNYTITENGLIHDDVLGAKLATLLVKNTITRRSLSWFDISKNAWVIGTLYNMGNPQKKEPHENPQIWWSIIEIDGKEFSYGEISLGMYNYLNKIDQEKANVLTN